MSRSEPLRPSAWPVYRGGESVRLVGVHPLLLPTNVQPATAEEGLAGDTEARLARYREGEAVEAVNAPRRVESSVLVLEELTDPSGMTWRPGDRAPLARRAVREAVRERPELFVMEYETVPVDLDLLAELDERFEAQFAEIKRHRDGAEERRQKALREEIEAQNTPQPELERRFREQEKEREERAKRRREAAEREQIEREVELGLMGFHND